MLGPGLKGHITLEAVNYLQGIYGQKGSILRVLVLGD